MSVCGGGVQSTVSKFKVDKILNRMFLVLHVLSSIQTEVNLPFNSHKYRDQLYQYRLTSTQSVSTCWFCAENLNHHRHYLFHHHHHHHRHYNDIACFFSFQGYYFEILWQQISLALRNLSLDSCRMQWHFMRLENVYLNSIILQPLKQQFVYCAKMTLYDCHIWLPQPFHHLCIVYNIFQFSQLSIYSIIQ